MVRFLKDGSASIHHPKHAVFRSISIFANLEHSLPVFHRPETTIRPRKPSPTSPHETNAPGAFPTFCQKPRSIFDAPAVKNEAKSGKKRQNHHTYAQILRPRKNPRKPMSERLSGVFTSRGTRTRTQDTRFWSQCQMSNISQCLSDSCSARTRKRCVFDAVPKFPVFPMLRPRWIPRSRGRENTVKICASKQ